MRLFRDLSPVRPPIGLAIDEVLLNTLRCCGSAAVRFWVDERAAVIGRAQAVRDEVDLEAALQYGVSVGRRMSGGGAVYHDAGNLNVSVIAESRAVGGAVDGVFRCLGEAIAGGVRRLGVAIEAIDNGLFVGEAKIGGAAQARRGDAVLYHTTFLVRSPEISPESVLRAMRSGYRPTGVASRPRHITSLDRVLHADVSLTDAATAVWEGLRTVLGEAGAEGTLTTEEGIDAERLASSKYGEAGWIFSR